MIRALWAKLVSWGWDYSYETIDGNRGRHRLVQDVIVDDDCSSIDLPDPIRFKVQTVSGGTVVETRWYDNKGEHRTKLHIITGDENLSEAIGKIVTMELLQR
jgi:hypothetical protein